MRGLILIALMVLWAAAAELDWVYDFDTAKEQAAKENKLIMVMISQEGCPACDYMESVVFTSGPAVEIIQLMYVPLFVDIDEGPMPKGLRPFGTPTFYFLDANGKKIARQLVGGMKEPEFINHIRKVKEEYTR